MQYSVRVEERKQVFSLVPHNVLVDERKQVLSSVPYNFSSENCLFNSSILHRRVCVMIFSLYEAHYVRRAYRMPLYARHEYFNWFLSVIVEGVDTRLRNGLAWLF